MATTSVPHRRSEAFDIDVPEPGEYEFHFKAGRPCLDLVATIGERWRRGFERLRTPEDLGQWVAAAGLTDHAPVVTDDDLVAARRLRGAIARVAMTWGSGQALPPDDIAIVNAAAAVPDIPPALDADGSRAQAPTVPVAAALSAVARDAITLVTEGDPARLRECAADDCSLLFEDTSRPGSRRWCSMGECGSRHKSARYRRRMAAR